MKQYLPARAWPWLALLLLLGVSVLVLRIEGRVWWCECGRPLFWVGDPRSSHTSQHLADPYSFTHLQHGLLFWALLHWWKPRLDWRWGLVAATAIEAGWEMLENSPPVIQRYREGTAALGYEGDSVVNSLGDILSCALGFALGRRYGWRLVVTLLIVIEIALVLTIRDSLILSVLMLLVDVEPLKQWQAGG